MNANKWFIGKTLAGDMAIVTDCDSVVCNFAGRHGASVAKDARLIACSKELLAASKRVTDSFRAIGNAKGIGKILKCQVECERSMVALDEIIAKATGGEA